jgi:hypothetical protein
MKERIAYAITARLLFVQDAGIIVELAQKIEEHCPAPEELLRKAILDNIQARLPVIITHEETLANLMASAFLVQTLLTSFGNAIATGRISEFSNSAVTMTPPPSPRKTRHNPRLLADANNIH